MVHIYYTDTYMNEWISRSRLNFIGKKKKRGIINNEARSNKILLESNSKYSYFTYYKHNIRNTNASQTHISSSCFAFFQYQVSFKWDWYPIQNLLDFYFSWRTFLLLIFISQFPLVFSPSFFSYPSILIFQRICFVFNFSVNKSTLECFLV